MGYRVNLNYNPGRGSFLHATLEQTDFEQKISEETHGQVVVNLGSGNLRPIPHAINVDFIDGEEVDIVSSAYELEFADNSVDCVVCIGLLEHVRYPAKVILEIQRILKPGGKVYCTVPFLQPLHPSPEDYWRTTVSGLETWFEDFDKIESGFNSGPSSTLSWFLHEYEKYINANLTESLSPILPLLKGSVKYIDDYLLHQNKLDFEKANALACSIYFYGQKKRPQQPDQATENVVHDRSHYRAIKYDAYFKSYIEFKKQIQKWAQGLQLGKFAIYATGDLCELLISALDDTPPQVIIDRDSARRGTLFRGIPVVSLDEIDKHGITHIIIASFSHKEVIREELARTLHGKNITLITPDF